MSAIGGKADIVHASVKCLLMTQSGRERLAIAAVQPDPESHLDMILAGLCTVHDNCKLLEEQGGNIHVS